MAIYIDTVEHALADRQAAVADIMSRYSKGPHREAALQAIYSAYGWRHARATDAEIAGGALVGANNFVTDKGATVEYDTDAKTFSFADPANGWQVGYSAFPVYYDADALIVQELGDDGRLHPIARRAA